MEVIGPCLACEIVHNKGYLATLFALIWKHDFWDHNMLCFVLQTLNSISAEKNSTIIFPLPIDFIPHFLKDGSGEKDKKMD